VQLAAVRLDAGAESLLVERLEVLGVGAHGVYDGGRPENSSPGGGQQQHRGATHQPIFSASSTMIPAGPRT
jgi:hypothetical protein